MSGGKMTQFRLTRFPDNVYISAGWVNSLSILDQEALVLHELIHNIAGAVDSVLQTALGIATNVPSKNIADKLEADCFK